MYDTILAPDQKTCAVLNKNYNSNEFTVSIINTEDDQKAFEKSKIAILKPAKTSDLERHGNGYFKVDTIASLSSDESSKVHQGFYEKGNVQPLNEMVDMMQTMQLFESQQKAMRTTDELLGKITSQLGRY